MRFVFVLLLFLIFLGDPRPANAAEPRVVQGVVLSSDNPDLKRALQAVQPFLEEHTGLPFKREVKISLLEPAKYRELLRKDFAVDRPNTLRQLRLLESFNLLSAGEAMKVLEKSLSEQSTGLYSPAAKELRIVHDRNALEIDYLTLVHELNHALLDQHFDLRSLSKGKDEDAGFAALAVTEGLAKMAEAAFLQWKHDRVAVPSEETLRRAFLGAEREIRNLYAVSPLAVHPSLRSEFIVEADLRFPYTYGLRYVANQGLANRHRWHAWYQSLLLREALPLSTADILREGPVDAVLRPEALPLDLTGLNGQVGNDRPWQWFTRKSLWGEFYTRLWLRQNLIGSRTALLPELGWAGDRVLLVEDCRTHRLAGAIVLLFLTESHARAALHYYAATFDRQLTVEDLNRRAVCQGRMLVLMVGDCPELIFQGLVAASKALRLPAHRESPSRRAVALLQEYRVTADPVAWRQFRSLVEPGKVEPRVLDALQTAAFALPDVSEERQAEEESVRRQLAFGLILTEPTFLEQLGQTGRTALAEAALQALGTDGTPVGRLNATRFLWAARAELSAAQWLSFTVALKQIEADPELTREIAAHAGRRLEESLMNWFHSVKSAFPLALALLSGCGWWQPTDPAALPDRVPQVSVSPERLAQTLDRAHHLVGKTAKLGNRWAALMASAEYPDLLERGFYLGVKADAPAAVRTLTDGILATDPNPTVQAKRYQLLLWTLLPESAPDLGRAAEFRPLLRDISPEARGMIREQLAQHRQLLFAQLLRDLRQNVVPADLAGTLALTPEAAEPEAVIALAGARGERNAARYWKGGISGERLVWLGKRLTLGEVREFLTVVRDQQLVPTEGLTQIRDAQVADLLGARTLGKPEFRLLTGLRLDEANLIHDLALLVHDESRAGMTRRLTGFKPAR